MAQIRNGGDFQGGGGTPGGDLVKDAIGWKCPICSVRHQDVKERFLATRGCKNCNYVADLQAMDEMTLSRGKEIQRIETAAIAEEKKLEDTITKLVKEEAVLEYKLELKRSQMSLQQQRKKTVKEEAVIKADRIREKLYKSMKEALESGRGGGINKSKKAIHSKTKMREYSAAVKNNKGGGGPPRRGGGGGGQQKKGGGGDGGGPQRRGGGGGGGGSQRRGGGGGGGGDGGGPQRRGGGGPQRMMSTANWDRSSYDRTPKNDIFTITQWERDHGHIGKRFEGKAGWLSPTGTFRIQYRADGYSRTAFGHFEYIVRDRPSNHERANRCCDDAMATWNIHTNQSFTQWVTFVLAVYGYEGDRRTADHVQQIIGGKDTDPFDSKNWEPFTTLYRRCDQCRHKQ